MVVGYYRLLTISDVFVLHQVISWAVLAVSGFGRWCIGMMVRPWSFGRWFNQFLLVIAIVEVLFPPALSHSSTYGSYPKPWSTCHGQRCLVAVGHHDHWTCHHHQPQDSMTRPFFISRIHIDLQKSCWPTCNNKYQALSTMVDHSQPVSFILIKQQFKLLIILPFLVLAARLPGQWVGCHQAMALTSHATSWFKPWICWLLVIVG